MLSGINIFYFRYNCYNHTVRFINYSFTNLQLPIFYIENYDPSEKTMVLSEENSRHIIQVLRMQAKEPLHLTDGKGTLLTVAITEAHKKHCRVQVTATAYSAKQAPEITIAISPLKNINRFEWFIEKATELGIAQIVPLVCARTEKQKIRMDRMRSILVSAMLQSRQQWLPALCEPTGFLDYIHNNKFVYTTKKYIAHCNEGDKSFPCYQNISSVILIGPEGDFAANEIDMAIKAGCTPVTLGHTRLRTETAGVVAATLLRLG